MKVISESYPMNTNMTGFRFLGEISLSIERVKIDETPPYVFNYPLHLEIYHQDVGLYGNCN